MERNYVVLAKLNNDRYIALDIVANNDSVATVKFCQHLIKNDWVTDALEIEDIVLSDNDGLTHDEKVDMLFTIIN